jgi:hypothetical protein
MLSSKFRPWHVARGIPGLAKRIFDVITAEKERGPLRSPFTPACNDCLISLS